MYHDYYTHTHSVNVCIYAVLFGEYKKMAPVMIRRLGEAAILHDIGKADVDHRIINKAGKLSETEFMEVQRHPHKSYEAALHFGVKDPHVLSGIRYHHEKMDGTGYPGGLLRNEIPYTARIIALCDIFDALTTRRSYKEALTTPEAFRLIKERMHNHIDPDTLNEFIRMLGNDEGAPL
jgi:HD-GYP domain-containing protein (c-di-GMP phosphodiesterase class II)